MAKIKLSESTFKLIPEGTTTFKVMSVDDSKYEDFGKLEVKLQTVKGETHIERFGLLNDKGEVNEGALKAWSYFARVCLNNPRAEEIDTQDIVGCYIVATVKHETYTRTRGEKKGQEATTVRLTDYESASGFSAKCETVSDDEEVDDLEDLDKFLDE